MTLTLNVPLTFPGLPNRPESENPSPTLRPVEVEYANDVVRPKRPFRIFMLRVKTTWLYPELCTRQVAWNPKVMDPTAPRTTTSRTPPRTPRKTCDVGPLYVPVRTAASAVAVPTVKAAAATATTITLLSDRIAMYPLSLLSVLSDCLRQRPCRSDPRAPQPMIPVFGPATVIFDQPWPSEN